MAPSVHTIHLLLPLLLLTFTCEAQVSPPPPPPQAFNEKFNPSMAVIIVVLIGAFFFLGFFSIYLRQCGDDREESVRPNRAGRSRRAARRGLDPDMIERLPTLVYSDVKEHKIGKGALECAVCISEFEDDEVLRLLPKCDHVFHPECIDQWLESHTTCPVCRANLAVSDDPGVSPLPSEAFGAGVSVASAVPVVTPAADAGVPAGAEEDDQRSPRPDHVVIPIAEESVEVERQRGTEGSTTPRAVDLRRTRSRRRSFKYRFSWRSKSARPAIGARAAQFWPEEEHERFTLRLPEYVRREVLSGKLSRSVSVLSFPTQESSRRGYRGEGSSRGGRSFKNGGGRWDWATKSDRWAFLSFNWRGGGDGDGSIKRGDGSMKRGEGSMRRGGGEGGNEGSTKGKVTSNKRGGRPSGLVAGSGVSREAESTNADVEGSKKELIQL